MIETSNPEQFENWNGEGGERWVADADLRDRVLAPVAERLLDFATIDSGMSVLDVGCGCGVTTLAASGIVGETGHVVGLDLSEPMLTVARTRAAAAAHSNVTFLHGDAQSYPLAAHDFDVAMSRFGTMFFGDPETAFTNIAGSMRSGANIFLATWQPLEANDWLLVPGAALLSHAPFEDLPLVDPSAPGMFAQSDPDRITSILESAGFDSIVLEAERVRFNIGDSPADGASYLASTGPGRALLGEIPDGDPTEAAMSDVIAALSEFETDEGVVISGGIWLVAAAV